MQINFDNRIDGNNTSFGALKANSETVIYFRKLAEYEPNKSVKIVDVFEKSKNNPVEAKISFVKNGSKRLKANLYYEQEGNVTLKFGDYTQRIFEPVVHFLKRISKKTDKILSDKI
jgi:hypothetical protein